MHTRRSPRAFTVTFTKISLMLKWLGCILVVALISCGDKNTSLSGDAPVKKEDFYAAFNKMKLPVNIFDTSLTRIGDTTVISRTVLTQFIPDSVVKMIAGNDKKLVIKPVGKIETDEELYLLTKFIRNKNISLGVFVLDKDNKFLDAKELVHNNNNDDYSHAVGINREPTFTISQEKMTKDNKLFYTRTGYAYNKDAGFMVVVNDSNEDTRKKDSIINPIDTFPRVNKYSGDYVRDKKNFISVRDGRNANTYRFFVYFEKNSGACRGELKGEMTLKGATQAQYTATGDPCVINFTFSGNQLQMKEEGSCGNHRDIKCFFNDSYTKKKVAKPKAKKK